MHGDVFGIVGTTQAGFFRIDGVVAEGGFGVVYRAFHTAFRAPVALKCLKVPDTMTPADRDQFLERFREEGEMLFRLSSTSPAIVRPLHVDALVLEGGRFVPFLALEWLEGEPFDVIIHRRNKQGKAPLGIRALVPFLQPIAHALAQAHSLTTQDGHVSIIHRDIKPDNIFVVRQHGRESVRILDFGIARAKSAASLHVGLSTSGSAFDAFTPRYAAPEQWLPKRYGQTGPWTDVWGLALTMVEALTGEPPIGGSNDVAAMMGIALDPTFRPTPRLLGAEVPDAVEQAFLHALLVDPCERTQSIEKFWTELETALELPLSFRPSVRPRLSSAISVPPPPMSRSLAETQPASKAASSESPPLPGDAIRVTPVPPPKIDIMPNGRKSPVPLAPIKTKPNERATPFPKQTNLPSDLMNAMPAVHISVPPNEHSSSPVVVNPMRVDVDVSANTAPQTPPVEKANSRPYRIAVAAPESPVHESHCPVDWADIWTRLRWPAQIMLVALGILIAELYYPRTTSSALEVFGVRPVWAAAAVATVALSWACLRLFFGR